MPDDLGAVLGARPVEPSRRGALPVRIERLPNAREAARNLLFRLQNGLEAVAGRDDRAGEPLCTHEQESLYRLASALRNQLSADVGTAPCTTPCPQPLDHPPITGPTAMALP